MKSLLFVAILILTSVHINAQWYSKHGVSDINDLSEQQLEILLQKSRDNVKTGKILTYTGFGVGTIGLIVSVNATANVISDPFTVTEEELDDFTYGGVLMLLGIGAMVVGIPLWAINASRRNKVEIAIINFHTRPSSGIDHPVYPIIKPPATYGLSLKINY